jgi:hypothetical protein
MISFLLDTILYGSLWVVKISYNGIYYMVNGSEESSDEKLNRLIKENIEYQKEIKQLLEELKLNNNKLIQSSQD